MIGGSFIGGIKETQDMLDFCGISLLHFCFPNCKCHMYDSASKCVAKRSRRAPSLTSFVICAPQTNHAPLCAMVCTNGFEPSCGKALVALSDRLFLSGNKKPLTSNSISVSEHDNSLMNSDAPQCALRHVAPRFAKHIDLGQV